jgi:hypothetical protein
MMKNIQPTISTVLAFIAVAMVVRAVGVDPSNARPAPAAEPMPTPYSAAHAEVQARPGTAEEQPPTF